MAGLTTFRLRWMGLLGRFPSAEQLEQRRSSLEANYQKYVEYEQGAEWKRFCELEAYERSGQAKRVEEECRSSVFSGSPEEAKLKELHHLSKQKSVRLARKGKGDPSDPAYLRYVALEQETSSSAFRERVAYLKDKRKYAKTDAAHALQELKVLRASSGVRWYQAMSKRPEIARRAREEVVFFDDFDASKLDGSRWLPRFAWADSTVGKGYSCSTDAHCYTEGRNLSLGRGCLQIETRSERADGLAWDDRLGFVTREFSYTSGVLSTGGGFLFREGLLEAKVRFGGGQGVVHALYLRGMSTYPHVEVFRSSADGSEVSGGCYTSGSDRQGGGFVGKLPYGRDFFIFSLRREGDLLEWAINGVPFHSHRVGGSLEPLHVVFASAVEAGHEPTESAQLEVDWVRCTVMRS